MSEGGGGRNRGKEEGEERGEGESPCTPKESNPVSNSGAAVTGARDGGSMVGPFTGEHSGPVGRLGTPSGVLGALGLERMKAQ